MLPAEILGQVYEQFLGKVIRLTKGGQAKVEEKPEVRKAGGVYYTPAYIVDYIVENTVGKLLEGKTPKRGRPKLRDSRSGLRLRLVPDRGLPVPLDWHRDWYVDDEPGEARPRPQPGALPRRRRPVAADHGREEAHPAEQHLRRGHRPAGRGGDQAFAAAEGLGGRIERDDLPTSCGCSTSGPCPTWAATSSAATR